MDGILMKKGADSRREDSPNLYYPLYANLGTGEIFLENKEGLEEIYPIKSN
jgi:adenine-specific DNA-methyltransferase